MAVTDASFPDTLINGVPVVTTPAEIDITTAEKLGVVLLEATSNGYERAHAEGSELRVVVPAGGAVARVFALTGIDRFVPCFAHPEEALANPPCRADMQPMAPAPPTARSDERVRRAL